MAPRIRTWCRRSTSGASTTPSTPRNTLNRKYLLEAIDPSLERFGLDHLDIVYCHRPDPETPIEETVWAMSDIVSSGRAHYWGTSEWSAAEIRAAWEIAERHHLHKPVVEQPEYNLFNRRKVEREYAPALRGDRPRPHHLEPAGVGPAHRQVLRRRAGGQPRRPAWLRMAAGLRHRPGAQRQGAAARRRRPAISTARWRSSPSRGASATPMSRRSSRARAGSSRSTRTWRRSRCSSGWTTRPSTASKRLWHSPSAAPRPTS